MSDRLTMPPPSFGRRLLSDRRRASILVAGVVAWWTLYALMLAGQMVDLRSASGQAYGWPQALVSAFGSSWAWVPMTLAAYLSVSRFPLGRKRFLAGLAINVGLIAGFIVFKAIYAVVTNPIFDWYPALPPVTEILVTSLRNNVILGVMVVATIHGVVYFERMEEREHRLAALETNLALARLEAVKAQINPHFLFNSLNSVAELMQVDIEQADRMLVAICEMLRDGLRADQKQERPLRDELKHVTNYLMIEEIRLGERMTSHIRVDEACLDVPVPSLSLQPLVENAVVHAIARSRTPGWVSVTGWIDGADLHVSVENSRALEGARKGGNGMGQRVVEERLRLLYGDRGRMHKHEQETDVYRVQIQVPLPERGDPSGRSAQGAPL
ncbi:sensor histidine kinase [Lysobacter silvisoli]|uniref:Signal transduction histidine kinase internal region domain-containing protein n=1 Tax=Lysobacter silvisoli TaxID=2293254 RepID=A0A371K0D1_9GAMM|nr:histidine kinase [Lysobacter silvisoli]RDZ27297.1 hypothetical protein DX914_13720 [Lysobacter silvisoli]